MTATNAMVKTIQLERIIKMLGEMVAFDTTSRNSNLALIDWVDDYLTGLGFSTELIFNRERTKANLFASCGPIDTAGYILSGHTDVVPVDGQTWSGNPFRLRREGNRLYGRGVCDMKGFLAVCLCLAPKMAAAPLRRPLHLAFSYDEELGCLGARDLVSHVAGLEPRPLGCFVGEPTEMRVVLGHKSKRGLRSVVRGHTCHSSLAPHGVNAVVWGARLVEYIHQIGDRFAKDGARDPLYDVPHSTANVGKFHGGEVSNSVPDHASIDFEFRTIIDDSPELYIADAIAHARSVLEPQMKRQHPLAGFEFSEVAGYPGLETDPMSAFALLAKSLAQDDIHAKVAFGTEAGLFAADAGVQSVVIGPGAIAQAHTADEWIEVSQLLACLEFVDRLVTHCGLRVD